IGLKTTIDELIRFNISLYQSDYKDLQVVSRNDNGGSQLLNAASAKLRGAEAEIQVRPARGLDLNFGASYIHGRYTDYANASVTVPNGLGGNSMVFRDATGNDMIRTPEWSLMGGIVYSTDLFNGEFVTSANVNYQSRQF